MALLLTALGLPVASPGGPPGHLGDRPPPAASDYTAELGGETAWDPSQAASPALRLTNLTDRPLSISVKYVLRPDDRLESFGEPEPRDADFAPSAVGPDEVVGQLQTEVAARYSRWVPLQVGRLAAGAYRLVAQTESGSSRRRLVRHLFTMPPEMPPPSPASPFGVNGASFDYFDVNRRLGVGWVRFDNMKWAMFCDAPDRFAFDGTIAPWRVRHDEFVAAYRERGIQVLPYVFQTPEWASSAPPEVRRNRRGWPPRDGADYGEAMYQIAARYGRRAVPSDTLRTADRKTGLGAIQYFQLWNEPNLQGPDWAPWVGSLAQYYEMFRLGAEGVKRADPDARVLPAGLAGIEVELVDSLRRHTYADGRRPLDFADAIAVHFYSGRQPPETATHDPNARRSGKPTTNAPPFPKLIRDLVQWRNRHAPGKPIWMTETGYDVGGPIGLGEREQAAKIPRVVLLSLAAGVDKVFVYREKGSQEIQHGGAGLCRHDDSLRPAWFTYATLIRQFQGVEPGGAERLAFDDPSVWIFLWERRGRPLLTAWTLNPAAEIRPGPCRVTDSFGRTRAVGAGEAVRLSEFPVYISDAEFDADWRARIAAAKKRAPSSP